MTPYEFFRSVRPAWEGSIEWDDNDKNLPKIEARVERLVDIALDSDEMAETAAAEISDEAYNYIVA